MACPVCRTRKGKRACPALGQDICAVCCGTKRLTEIACPSDCGYLASARAHPPAVVARQRERDLRFALPMLHKLPERTYQLLLFLQAVVKAYRKTALPPLVDSEVAEAAAALASTLETAARGILYEHQPPTLAAQRVVTELRAALATLGRDAGPGLEADAAVALRRMERAARDARTALEPSATAYLAFLDRLPDVPLRGAPGAPGDEERPPGDQEGRGAPGGGRIIVP